MAAGGIVQCNVWVMFGVCVSSNAGKLSFVIVTCSGHHLDT
jgi:hypothetical protein